ncbi:AraC-type DNA-binding protein [Catalinimonas alkaloidigena]|uniref:AraC-type DNA-binding protein n=1 Tax=Catalinimonas alkaloidigena TaxID=1075417 RepID=A0A1G9A7Z9_9BACT|nr:AraC family transcriptional regulator [Catalinimonas alkaloidigena]SDK23476.1 AraC-type DNA-binding protein [Catalinimonas alkaloidigena]
MKRQNLHEAYAVSFETWEASPDLGHKHSFFELVYILSGTGRQCINQHQFDYQPGHLFLLTPQDCHAFEIETPTTFFFLRFNDIYLKSGAFQADQIERLEFILQNASHQPGCILRHRSDKSLVQPMVEAIYRESIQRDLYNQELEQQLINTLIVVVARNIAKYLPETVDDASDEKILAILQYIQQHIYAPDQLRAKVISERFGLSETYLGRYFKKHTQETLQQYIAHYRTRMIEHRLRHSDLRIHEIALDFGFTDESHLNKFFKKQKGHSPVAYRKQLREAAA